MTDKSYTVQSGSEHMDVTVIHEFLKSSYWANNIPLDIVQRSIANSLCFGVFFDGQQVGFARLITDYATFGYLADVFVLEGHRGQGLARRMITGVLAHPDVRSLRKLMLLTEDAQDLYRPFGFVNSPYPERIMMTNQFDPYEVTPE